MVQRLWPKIFLGWQQILIAFSYCCGTYSPSFHRCWGACLHRSSISWLLVHKKFAFKSCRLTAVLLQGIPNSTLSAPNLLQNKYFTSEPAPKHNYFCYKYAPKKAFFPAPKIAPKPKLAGPPLNMPLERILLLVKKVVNYYFRDESSTLKSQLGGNLD